MLLDVMEFDSVERNSCNKKDKPWESEKAPEKNSKHLHLDCVRDKLNWKDTLSGFQDYVSIV